MSIFGERSGNNPSMIGGSASVIRVEGYSVLGATLVEMPGVRTYSSLQSLQRPALAG